MANIAFGSKYFIFSKFSSIPKTSKIEQERANLIKELDDFTSFKTSDELKDFIDLEKYLSSEEHKSLMNSIQSEKRKEQEKIKSYETQKKSKKFKDHFKFKESAKLKNYLTFKESQELKEFEELEKFATSSEFAGKKKTNKEIVKTEESRIKEYKALEKSKPIKNYLKKLNSDKNRDEKSGSVHMESKNQIEKYNSLKDYINSDKHKTKLTEASNELKSLIDKEKEYLKKKKSSAIKSYNKFDNSQKYKDFQKFDQSKELKNYLELEKYLASDEHKDLMKSLEEKESTENDKKKQYEDFKNSKKYKWFLEVKDSNKFDEVKKWDIVFEENFDKEELDTEKWMTRYFWGDKLINDAYALEHDKAFPTDGANIDVSHGTARIVTKSESCEGKVWKQPFGFIPQDFKYTTGLISTAKSFRQKYGKFEAKIKVNFAKPVNYNFWMASEKNLPHVDILRLEKKKSKVDMSHHTGNISNKNIETKKADFSGLDVSQDYFIYTFEWTANKLTWKINDVVVNEQTQNIPQEEMYIVFSSSMTGKADSGGLPASMDIDWVKCYHSV